MTVGIDSVSGVEFFGRRDSHPRRQSKDKSVSLFLGWDGKGHGGQEAVGGHNPRSRGWGRKASGRKGGKNLNLAELGKEYPQIPSQAYMDVVLGDSPVGYWRCNDIDVSDGTQIHNTATVLQTAFVNGIVTHAKSLVSSEPNGSSIAFSATGNIKIGNNGAINANPHGHTHRTIELWFEQSHMSNTAPQVLYEEGGSVRGICIWVTKTGTITATLSLYIYNRDSKQVVFGNPSAATTLSCEVTQGKRYYVALVFSGTTGTINAYLRSPSSASPDSSDSSRGSVLWDHCGTPVSNLPRNAVLHAHHGGIALGGVNEDTRLSDTRVITDGIFEGRIDEVAIYNSALTKKQLQSHYLAAEGVFPSR